MTTYYRPGSPGTAADAYRIHAADTGAAMTVTDRTNATEAEFAALRLEQRETVDIGRDVEVEKVARAICLAAYHGEPEWIWDRMGSPLRDDYLRLATAALDAMTPADEGLRARIEAMIEVLEADAVERADSYVPHVIGERSGLLMATTLLRAAVGGAS